MDQYLNVLRNIFKIMKNKEIIKKNNNTEVNKNKFLGILAIINKHF